MALCPGPAGESVDGKIEFLAVGLSAATEQFEGFAYREPEFEPQSLSHGHDYYGPALPAGYVSTGESAIERAIDAANVLRETAAELIGGELYVTGLTREGIMIHRLHRFPDYDQVFEAIARNHEQA